MTESSAPTPEAPDVASDRGGENAAPVEHPTHDPGPHDDQAREPLGPLTPDDETPLGDSPELHDSLIPQDLPKDHPGRHEAEREAAEGDGTVRGNT